MVSRKVARVARRLDRRMGEDIEVLNVRGKEFVVTDGHRQAKVPRGMDLDALKDAIRRMRAEGTPRETSARQPIRARPPRPIQRIVVAA
ncbi:MAG: hypothetical protein A2946_00275 [Candidatus Liptonbacteria bacterium RIFCSPLOWO2_01_FULL_53_13]|uniref:Uncharacterized protein n=1 Tax=Candidatus Liptonbacteria bacterium RIFCSPLOWO2_01_FULL_53_13 TaxID=1798651 RepID=A0A1G2CLL8_9BACT|nr:MAG: hypothetical protein A2946_00275 [Candidatus Liptonbacteria bacterium RIFCSPLOWO2_01_FULL_53_13]